MILETVVTGLSLAALYALAAFGLAIVFGVLKILNFAHGSLLVLGAYGTVALVDRGVSFWAAALVSVLAVALLGVVLERTLFRRVEDEPVAGLVLSIGLIAISETFILQAFGPDPHHLDRLIGGSVTWFGAVIPKEQILIMVLAAGLLSAAELAIARTGWGKLLRATAEDGEAAALLGVPVARVKTIAFALGAGLAALSGVIIGTTTPVEPLLGQHILIKAFIIIIIGGAGSIGGTLTGAAVLGVAEALSLSYLNQVIAQVVPLLVLGVVLFVRPQGLFGRVSVRT